MEGLSPLNQTLIKLRGRLCRRSSNRPATLARRVREQNALPTTVKQRYILSQAVPLNSGKIAIFVMVMLSSRRLIDGRNQCAHQLA